MSRASLAHVAHLHLEHLATVKARRPQTVEDYRVLVSRHFLPFFGQDVILDDILPRDVKRCLAHQFKRRARGDSCGAAGSD